MRSVGCVCDPVEVPRDDCTCNVCREPDRKVRFVDTFWIDAAKRLGPEKVFGYTEPSNTGGAGHPEYLRLLDEMREVHLEKSGGYGTGEDPFANYNAVARFNGRPAYAYAVDRVIEKLERWKSLFAQGRFEELGEEHLDAASLLLCAEALRRQS